MILAAAALLRAAAAVLRVTVAAAVELILPLLLRAASAVDKDVLVQALLLLALWCRLPSFGGEVFNVEKEGDIGGE